MVVLNSPFSFLVVSKNHKPFISAYFSLPVFSFVYSFAVKQTNIVLTKVIKIYTCIFFQNFEILAFTFISLMQFEFVLVHGEQCVLVHIWFYLFELY